MGSDEFFKKKRAERCQRHHGYRQPRSDSFLIVTEGEKTEPLYFKGLKNKIKQEIGGNLDIYEIPLIQINGEGCSTNALIKKTEELINKAKIMYQHVWIVFDKDDFIDFDEAILEGTQKGFNIAWSNQSFEYWIFLHFDYSDSALHRNTWNAKVSDLFKKYQLGDGKYHKNYENIYDLVNTFGGVNTAIKNAKRRMSNFNPKTTSPSEYDPGTTVHLLVEKLNYFLNE